MDSVLGTLYKSFTGGKKGLLIGGHQIVEERSLSEGGFGFVSLVRDVNSGEQFALKKMICQSRELYELAHQEVETLEALPPHPNIVGFHGAKVEMSHDGTQCVYLLMEYCSRGHLIDVLQHNHGLLPESAILRILLDITLSLHHLHSQTPSLIHRDIKLENVLCCSRGIYKLCDFGSASTEVYDPKLMNRAQTVDLEEKISKTTTLMYRPPEMANLYKKCRIAEKGDIWMVGCVLYSLLFNRHPFQDSSVVGITNANFEIDVSVAKKFPKIMDLIFWALSVDPELRPSTDTLLTVLQQYNKLDSIPLPQETMDRRRELMAKAEQTKAIRNQPLAMIPKCEIKAKVNRAETVTQKSATGVDRRSDNSRRSQRRDPIPAGSCSEVEGSARRTKRESQKTIASTSDDLFAEFQTNPFSPELAPSKSHPVNALEDWSAFTFSSSECHEVKHLQSPPTSMPPSAPSAVSAPSVSSFSAPAPSALSASSSLWIAPARESRRAANAAIDRTRAVEAAIQIDFFPDSISSCPSQTMGSIDLPQQQRDAERDRNSSNDIFPPLIVFPEEYVLPHQKPKPNSSAETLISFDEFDHPFANFHGGSPQRNDNSVCTSPSLTPWSPFTEVNDPITSVSSQEQQERVSCRQIPIFPDESFLISTTADTTTTLRTTTTAPAAPTRAIPRVSLLDLLS